MRRWVFRSLTLGLLIALAFPIPGSAQEASADGQAGVNAVCGTLDHLEGHHLMFADPVRAHLPESHEIPPLEPTDPQGIVRDTIVCRKLLRFVEDDLDTSLSPSEFGVYRFGEVYMLDLWFGDGCVEMEDGTSLCGFGSIDFYLFRAGTLKHLGTWFELG